MGQANAEQSHQEKEHNRLVGELDVVLSLGSE